jgi:DNA-binding NarL/FixJ family response regulator
MLLTIDRRDIPVRSERRADDHGSVDPRLLIVDDDASFRAVARRLLSLDGFDVVGEAADGAAAIRAVRDLRPDVVLLDVQLPGIDGFEVTDLLTSQPGAPDVVLVSSRSGDDYGGQVARSGARGFLPKAELNGDGVRRLLRRAPGSGSAL